MSQRNTFRDRVKEEGIKFLGDKTSSLVTSKQEGRLDHELTKENDNEMQTEEKTHIMMQRKTQINQWEIQKI